MNFSKASILNNALALVLTAGIVGLSACGGGGSTAGDTTAPTTTAAPAVSATTGTATTLSVTINENGTGYYLVLPASATAPTVAAVQAGTSFAMTANVAATPVISGLATATAYQIYFVAKDAANNVQPMVQSVAVTTAYLVQGGLTWMPVSGTAYDFTQATALCAGTINGQTGWRLPTTTELSALYASGAMNGQGWTLNFTWASTPSVPGNHEVVYLINGGIGGWSDSTAVGIYATCVLSNFPVANAGVAQNVTTGALVTLDGSASSDPNGLPLTYSWALTSTPAGSTATLSGATTAAPTFTADLAGTYVATLFVNDGTLTSTAATVTVTGLPSGYLVQGGLTWMPVTSFPASATWPVASAYCANTTINGVTGWRQPTLTELSALYTAYPDNSGVGLGNSTLLAKGWTLPYTGSSTQSSAGYHYVVDLRSGSFFGVVDTSYIYVSCVR